MLGRQLSPPLLSQEPCNTHRSEASLVQRYSVRRRRRNMQSEHAREHGRCVDERKVNITAKKLVQVLAENGMPARTMKLFMSCFSADWDVSVHCF